MNPITALKKQRGFSLIELMVALLLSALLILGITQIFIDNKRNHAFQQGQSDNIENARYALLLLEDILFQTGYRSRPDDSYENAFRSVPSGDCTFAAGEVINYDDEDQRLCLRYQPNLPVVSTCTGATATGGSEPYDANVTPVIIELRIDDNALLCNNVPLISNLVDIKLAFGVSDDTARETQKFTETPAAGDSIRSIRYAALIKSRATNLADSNNSPAYAAWMNKWTDGESTTAPDRALYINTENTIALRNLSR